jgi:hypothetical protein
MWKCPQCGENVEDNFDVCWSCGTTKEGVVDPHFLDTNAATPPPENEPMEPITGAVEENPEPLVTVARCSLSGEAYVIRARLEAEGIPVFVPDELTDTVYAGVTNMLGGVKVQVPQRYAERAAELLASVAHPDGPKTAEQEEA